MREKLPAITRWALAATGATLSVLVSAGNPETPWWLAPGIAAGFIVVGCTAGLIHLKAVWWIRTALAIVGLALTVVTFRAIDALFRARWSPLTIDYYRLTEVENPVSDGELRMVINLDTARAKPDSLVPGEGQVSTVLPHFVRECSMHMPPYSHSVAVENTTGRELRDLRIGYNATFVVPGDSVLVGARRYVAQITHIQEKDTFCFYFNNKTNLSVTVVPDTATARAWSGKDQRIQKLEITSNHLDQFAEPPLHVDPR